MSSLEHTQALDQLQKEVNRTVSTTLWPIVRSMLMLAQLQNLGHLFKAANNGSKTATTARANQLKTQLPNSINSFHDALDSLGDEIVGSTFSCSPLVADVVSAISQARHATRSCHPQGTPRAGSAIVACITDCADSHCAAGYCKRWRVKGT